MQAVLAIFLILLGVALAVSGISGQYSYLPNLIGIQLPGGVTDQKQPITGASGATGTAAVGRLF
jgi:hypothetical protein